MSTYEFVCHECQKKAQKATKGQKISIANSANQPEGGAALKRNQKAAAKINQKNAQNLNAIETP